MLHFYTTFTGYRTLFCSCLHIFFCIRTRSVRKRIRRIFRSRFSSSSQTFSDPPGPGAKVLTFRVLCPPATQLRIFYHTHILFARHRNIPVLHQEFSPINVNICHHAKRDDRYAHPYFLLLDISFRSYRLNVSVVCSRCCTVLRYQYDLDTFETLRKSRCSGFFSVFGPAKPAE